MSVNLPHVLFHLTFEFLPVSFELFFIHKNLLLTTLLISPIIFLSIVSIELSFVFAVESLGIKFGSALDRLARKIDVDIGIFPIDVSNPLRRYQDFLSGQPVAGINHHVANGPSIVVDDEVIDMADLAIGGLDRVAGNILHAAQVGMVHFFGEGNLSVDALGNQICGSVTGPQISSPAQYKGIRSNCNI